MAWLWGADGRRGTRLSCAEARPHTKGAFGVMPARVRVSSRMRVLSFPQACMHLVNRVENDGVGMKRFKTAGR